VHGRPCKPSRDAAQMDLSALQNNEPFPTTAMLPLSKYLNGFGVRPPTMRL
jgi:hypothetical protein